MDKKSSIIITALIFAIISVFVFHFSYKLGKHHQGMETYITQDDIEKKEYTVKVVFTDNTVDTLTITSSKEPSLIIR